MRGLGLVVFFLVCWSATGARARDPMPALVKAEGSQCVEPAPVMRRDHMRFLSHHYDNAVNRWLWPKRHSLAGCVACHAARDPRGQPVPVNAPGQFCSGCHTYVAVRIDCFECHAAIPEGD